MIAPIKASMSLHFCIFYYKLIDSENWPYFFLNLNCNYKQLTQNNKMPAHINHSQKNISQFEN